MKWPVYTAVKLEGTQSIHTSAKHCKILSAIKWFHLIWSVAVYGISSDLMATYSLCTVMPPCIAGCGHTYFHPVSFFFFLFSSPNFSGRRLDVTLVWFRMQVWNVLHAARWKYRTQKWRKKSPKIRHLGTIAQICRAISSHLRHVSTIRKTC